MTENQMTLVRCIGVVPAILLRGWATQTLWGWFVVPLGVMSIGLMHAYGLVLVAMLLTATSMVDHEKTIRDSIGALVNWLLWPPLCVVVGWSIKEIAW